MRKDRIAGSIERADQLGHLHVRGDTQVLFRFVDVNLRRRIDRLQLGFNRAEVSERLGQFDVVFHAVSPALGSSTLCQRWRAIALTQIKSPTLDLDQDTTSETEA